MEEHTRRRGEDRLSVKTIELEKGGEGKKTGGKM